MPETITPIYIDIDSDSSDLIIRSLRTVVDIIPESAEGNLKTDRVNALMLINTIVQSSAFPSIVLRIGYAEKT